MPQRIFITGMGIISGIGNDLGETMNSLLHSGSGIGKISYRKNELTEDFPVSEVKCSEEDLFNLAGIPLTEGYSRTSLMGIIAAREAWIHAKMVHRPDLKTGLISATTVGGMDKCELYYQDFLHNDSRNIDRK